MNVHKSGLVHSRDDLVKGLQDGGRVMHEKRLKFDLSEFQDSELTTYEKLMILSHRDAAAHDAEILELGGIALTADSELHTPEETFLDAMREASAWLEDNYGEDSLRESATAEDSAGTPMP